MCDHVASYFRLLKDLSGDSIFPLTRAEGIYFDDNTTLSRLYYFPIGYIFISTVEYSPAEIFGGTWEKIEGKFLLSSSSSHALLSEGGEESHLLTTAELPSHSHEYQMFQSGGDTEGASTGLLGTKIGTTPSQTGSFGENVPHNNMPPYITVNMWKRVA